jgi:hypothetical protein
VGHELEWGDLAAVQPVPLLLGAQVMEFEHKPSLGLDIGAQGWLVSYLSNEPSKTEAADGNG